MDDDGKIIGQITDNDLIGIGADAVNFVLNDKFLEIYDFFTTLNKDKKYLTVPKNSVFKDIIKIFAETKRTHLFAVDDKGKPVKLITLNDIICKFTPFDWQNNGESERLSMQSLGLELP